tara:strand:- start:298 stop:852 length:555 start_codon:yes stop_codon:yes gene_type:complete
MKTKIFILLILINAFKIFAQSESLIENYEIYKDPSLETQFSFVQELLYVAGYVPEKIKVYQTLPNHAHVYQVTLDSVNGGFIFVRWNKEKKEHYVANKMIDPGLYYNLNAAREIMRKQTQKATFSSEDKSLQASDQFEISEEDIKGLRGEYDKKIKAQKETQDNLHKKSLEKAKKKADRKKTKN